MLKVIRSKYWRSKNPWFFAELPISVKEAENWKIQCFQRAAAARNKDRQYNAIQHTKWRNIEALKKVAYKNENPNNEQLSEKEMDELLDAEKIILDMD